MKWRLSHAPGTLYGIYDAEALEWFVTAPDLQVLFRLAVGETYTDTDGDTWERIE